MGSNERPAFREKNLNAGLAGAWTARKGGAGGVGTKGFLG